MILRNLKYRLGLNAALALRVCVIFWVALGIMIPTSTLAKDESPGLSLSDLRRLKKLDGLRSKCVSALRITAQSRSENASRVFWESMSANFTRISNENFSGRPGMLLRMRSIASKRLREFYDRIGYHINFDAKKDEPAIHFEGFEAFSRKIQELRKSTARQWGVPIHRIFDPRFTFYDFSSDTPEVSVRPGQVIPREAKPSSEQIADGPEFYSQLARRVFPLAMPDAHNILNNNSMALSTTEHDLGHLFALLEGRPQMNDALAEVGRAIQKLQTSMEHLHHLTPQNRESFSNTDRQIIAKLQQDVQNAVEGIPYLSDRLFFAIETPYYIEKPIDWSQLPFHIEPRMGFENLAEYLFHLSLDEWKLLLRTLDEKLVEWPIPVGGASADLRYFFDHLETLPKAKARVPRSYYDHGLMTLLARARMHIQDKGVAVLGWKAELAIDIAKVLVFIEQSQPIPPEEWVNETVTKPVTRQAEIIREEIRRIVQATRSSAAENVKFNPDVFQLPGVDPNSRVGKFILTAPWVDRPQILIKFGLKDS